MSGGVKSGDLGGYSIIHPLLLIQRTEKVTFSLKILYFFEFFVFHFNFSIFGSIEFFEFFDFFQNIQNFLKCSIF